MRSSEFEEWLHARAQGVTATMVAKAFTASGFAQVVKDIESPLPVESNPYMLWGSEREYYIAMEVKERFGVLPNDWLIRKDAGLRAWQMATPDGLDPADHLTIGEYKTGGKPFKSVPAEHYRQVMWQLYVCDAQRCIYAYEQRLGEPGAFFPHYEIHTVEILRDDAMIADLVRVAEQVQMQLVYRDWDEMDDLANEVGHA